MTVLTVIIMLIKLILKDKLSAAMHCAMWIVLPIQTLFCIADVNIPSRASIYNVMPEAVIPAAARAANMTAAYDIRNLIALVYAAGVVVLMMWYVSVYVIHCVKVIRSERITDLSANECLLAVRARLGIKRKIILHSGGYAHTLLNMVVLPNGYSDEDTEQILLHELNHYKHRDNLKLWLAVGVICFNWFNPCVWLAFKRCRLDIEMYCDDSVIKMSGSRKAYARALVKTASNSIRFIPGTSSAANGKNEVAKRVKRIAAWKKKKLVWVVVALLAGAAAAGICLTNSSREAVETVVNEVKKTPEPVGNIQEMVEAAIPQATPEPDTKRSHAAVIPKEVQTPKPVPTPKPPKSTSQPHTQAPEPRPSSTTTTVEWEDIGEKVSESANGSKEVYEREDGSSVILQYDGDELKAGYIIEED